MDETFFFFRSHLEIAWNLDVNGSPAFQLSSKQHCTRKRLSLWNKVEFGDIDININSLKRQLDLVQQENFSSTQHDRIVNITKNLDNWFSIQSEFYKQKSGDKFITEMDNNTKYFHTLANRIMFRKNIDSLCDDNGVWHNDRNDISNMLVSHFSAVSNTSNPSFSDNTFDIIPSIISVQDSINLSRTPSSDEIHLTLKHMTAWSSPGPDGFQAGFYQSNWDIVGNSVVEVVQSFFENGYMPSEFNRAFLSLIPKTDDAKSPVDFRPIGLCNTVYKVISKILTDRIKPHLKHLISPYQAVFVSGRAIHDNIIVAHEMIHTMKHK